MNRRKFGIMGASSLAALSAYMGGIRPALAAADPNLLKTTLMPMGGERAGNADGSIPAWNGGLTQIPTGWKPSDGLMPDFFADDKKLYSVDASNMEQYADKLAEGTKLMMQKYGFRIDVYPTHRTASAPQWVYDNIATNVTAAATVPKGAKYGFTGAFGGVPFPILDKDPAVAGAQAMWNHATLWQGQAWTRAQANYLVDSTGHLTLAAGYKQYADFLYYLKGGTVADYKGLYAKYFVKFLAPASMVGQESIDWFPTNMLQTPERVWSYLPGQGRMREDPNLTYDTPAPSFDDYANSDEYDIFYGALDRYDWKLVGKKEMLVPYNNNKLYHATAQEGHMKHFLNPDLVRWELHRVWVIDAVVAPGKRNVLHHRRIYLDEDTWTACLGDSWDAQGNYWRHGTTTIENRPDIPAGALFSTCALYDLQANHYLTEVGIWNQAPYNQEVVLGIPPLQLFNPQAMAAQAQY